MLDRFRLMKSTRFGAHQRLELKHAVSVFSISMLSFYVFAIGLYPVVFAGTVSPRGNSALVFAAIVSSVFIIILSLLESGKNYQLRAYQMHACAKAINNLFRHLELEPDADKARLADYQGAYERIIDACQYNHTEIDFLLAEMAEHRRENSRSYTALVHARAAWDLFGFHGIMLTAPIVCLVLIW